MFAQVFSSSFPDLKLPHSKTHTHTHLITFFIRNSHCIIFKMKPNPGKYSKRVPTMNQNQELLLTQMKKLVSQKLGASTEKYGDTTLKRFLIARSMDPKKAAKMFVQWAKWRDSFVPSGFISDSEVVDELGSKKVYLQGLCKTGHPLVIIKASKHFSSGNSTQFKKFVVHVFDKSIASSFRGREIGDEKLMAILDLEQISYKNMDARSFITVFQFLQGYYPERLAKVFIIKMPWYFVSFWKMVTQFLEKATLEKFINVTNEEETSAFLREVGEETVPEEYGGKGKLVPIQDVVLPQLTG